MIMNHLPYLSPLSASWSICLQYHSKASKEAGKSPVAQSCQEQCYPLDMYRCNSMTTCHWSWNDKFNKIMQPTESGGSPDSSVPAQLSSDKQSKTWCTMVLSLGTFTRRWRHVKKQHHLAPSWRVCPWPSDEMDLAHFKKSEWPLLHHCEIKAVHSADTVD